MSAQTLQPAGKATQFSIIEDEEGTFHPRICAVNEWDIEIAGAYQPSDWQYWRAYITPLLATAAGMEFHPDHYLLGSREEARKWVNLVAHLYVRAAAAS